MLRNFRDFLLKWGLVELKNAEKGSLVEWLRERKKGVFTAGHPRYSYKVSIPPGKHQHAAQYPRVLRKQ